MDAQQSAGQEQKPGFMQQAWNKVEKFVEEDRKKLGGMTPGAMFRLGVAELREAVSLGGNVAQPTPLGMYGTMTPGEVGAARENEPSDVRRMEEEPLPSPSRIADGKSSASRHGDQQQGRENGQGHGRGM